MYRTWIKSPMTGQTGFLREFPDLGGGGKLHRWLASNCTFLPGSTNIAGIEVISNFKYILAFLLIYDFSCLKLFN
jgi:hypothetical protein